MPCLRRQQRLAADVALVFVIDAYYDDAQPPRAAEAAGLLLPGAARRPISLL